MTLIVVHRDYEDVNELMMPFCQDLEVEEWCVGDVSLYDKKQIVDYYEKKYNRKFESFDECYAEFGNDWNFNVYRNDEDGVWREYSTSNPNMKWDWWEVGGRWPGRLLLKEGATRLGEVNFSWGWPENERKEFLNEHPNAADQAYLKDIANLDSLSSYSILLNGEWNDIDGNVAPFLKGLDGDTVITCIDYHM